MMRQAVLLGLAIVVLALSTAGAGATGTTYVPKTGDSFRYSENVELTNGTGNYTGYSESTFYNGTIAVHSVLPNGTDNATYSTNFSYRNSGDMSTSGSAGAGWFWFSPTTYDYVYGTDNQTGLNGSGVWFLENTALPRGSTFSSEDNALSVVSTNTSYPLWTQGGKWVKTILAEGNGSFQRNDDYGVFTATYTWKEYYDPTTGFIVGYLYTESDSDGSGDGFTFTDALGVTSTSYALTAGVAPPPSTGSSSNGTSAAIVAVVVIVVVLILVVGIYLLVRSRRSPALQTHSRPGAVGYAPPPPLPPGMAPPPLNMNTGGQPAVQQIVVRETVKVPCRYCGTLIDSTATVCPKCGAPRT
ncbi:MAG: zinc ribbon domain-containing protein [Thermoplasmata archaeon]|nr:zinc ribbon domain-containing protein [Thermoplasmata archaeon]